MHRGQSPSSPIHIAQVNIKVLDVDEPPVFSEPMYTFSVVEERSANIGIVTARDPDKAKKTIRYNAGCKLI